MLNGIAPIIIFHFSKAVKDPKLSNAKKLPVSNSVLSFLPLPAIPIYLSERLSGLYIDTEDKNVDIETTIDTVIDDDPVKNQRGINNSVKVSMVASRDSLGLSLFAALTDLVFPRVTSKEYAITYLHGAVTVFSGLLRSFAIAQDPGTDMYRISFELDKPSTASVIKSTEVSASKGVSLADGRAVGS